ncbi:hypothetical protein Tco_1014853 [Tanacetum coccineum]
MNELRVRQTCHVALKREHEYINTVEEGSEETHTHRDRPWTTLTAIGFGYGANMLTEYPAEVGEDTQTSYQDASIELGKEWAKAEGELTCNTKAIKLILNNISDIEKRGEGISGAQEKDPGHHHYEDCCVIGSRGESVGSTVFGTTTDYMLGGFLSPSYLRYMEIKEHPQEIAKFQLPRYI